jgi:hypothetical protein
MVNRMRKDQTNMLPVDQYIQREIVCERQRKLTIHPATNYCLVFIEALKLV